MGIVVHLSERRRDTRPAPTPPESGATIHLFLGVRYERHVEPLTQPVSPERSGGGNRRTRKRA